jgi:hypothetical protein
MITGRSFIAGAVESVFLCVEPGDIYGFPLIVKEIRFNNLAIKR